LIVGQKFGKIWADKSISPHQDMNYDRVPHLTYEVENLGKASRLVAAIEGQLIRSR